MWDKISDLSQNNFWSDSQVCYLLNSLAKAKAPETSQRPPTGCRRFLHLTFRTTPISPISDQSGDLKQSCTSFLVTILLQRKTTIPSCRSQSSGNNTEAYTAVRQTWSEQYCRNTTTQRTALLGACWGMGCMIHGSTKHQGASPKHSVGRCDTFSFHSTDLNEDWWYCNLKAARSCSGRVCGREGQSMATYSIRHT